jgi:hypothetical protein
VDRCDECGFVYDGLAREHIADAVRLVAVQYASRLSGPDIGRRPTAERWSALEYAAHVRDVLHVQRECIGLALRFERPAFESMEAEQRVADHRYNEQDPASVVVELERAADHLASLLDDLSEHEWQRRGVYNWPSPAERDITWIGRHTVHEMSHHLLDVSRSIDTTPTAASGSAPTSSVSAGPG